jgi:hypothetical protein
LVPIFYDQLVYLTAIGNILWPFGIFCGNLVFLSPLGILDQEKSGNPDADGQSDPAPLNPKAISAAHRFPVRVDPIFDPGSML